MPFVNARWIAAFLAVASFQVTPAKAETFNTCAGFIDSLPATISTQGVWCLKKNLATSMTSGNAITIATNNVSIDCNGFKIGGLAAGTGSTTNGIYADGSRQNATIRNCAIRGFLVGIQAGGAGHLVEDNRLDQNLLTGVFVAGENHRVQRNAVYDTGGQPGSSRAYGIVADGDVLDNTVSGVFAAATNAHPLGIYVGTDMIAGGGSEVRGNRVRNLAVTGSGSGEGIYVRSPGATIADNRVSADAAIAGRGIYSEDGVNTFCTGNTVVNFATAYVNCAASEGNLSLPLANAESASLSFVSEPGDYIGLGQSRSYTQGLSSTASSDGRTIGVSYSGDTEWWYVDIAAPEGQKLVVGAYESATRYPFQASSVPGLSHSGTGRGCNTLTGRFDVTVADYDTSGNLIRFAASYEQHCEGAEPALWGEVSFEKASPPPAL